MRIVLIGKNGQLGREFQKFLPTLGELIALGRTNLDVSDLYEIQKTLIELHPDLVINTSAYTEVDLAETHIELAETINAQAPAVMAEAARKINAVFIHYSTDYVFDGKNNMPYTEQDPVNPLNIYGKSKFKGEENIKQAGEAYLILRTSWVYSLYGNSFVNKVLGWSRKNKVLKIVSDQISSPTWAQALAEITSKVLTNNATDLFNIMRAQHGIYHLAGNGYTSRYEWAKRILTLDPKRTEQLTQTIEPVLSSAFPTPAMRPSFSALDCTKFSHTFNIHLQNWDESLQQAMNET